MNWFEVVVLAILGLMIAGALVMIGLALYANFKREQS